MQTLADAIARAGGDTSEPYADAAATAYAVGALQRRTKGYAINQTDLLAHNGQEMIAEFDGSITEIWATVQAAVTTGGPIGINVNGTPVNGLSVTVANGAAVGTRYSDTSPALDGTEIVKKGDRITITSSGFATAGAVNGFFVLTQRD